MVIYSRTKDDADNDLEFRLKRSIELVKENQMATRKSKKNGNKERASVSREKRLALALRAVLDAIQDSSVAPEAELVTAASDASDTLTGLGYETLVGVPRRLKELNEQLTMAVEAKDGAAIARIGAEMVKVQAGKDVTEKAKAATAE